jgi:molybdopterin converting factor small subunit
MTVTVEFIGSLRGVSGRNKMTLKFESSASLRALVKNITEQLPKTKSALVDSASGEPRVDLLVLVNGSEISALNGLETLVNDGDEVVFVPVIHGG